MYDASKHPRLPALSAPHHINIVSFITSIVLGLRVLIFQQATVDFYVHGVMALAHNEGNLSSLF